MEEEIDLNFQNKVLSLLDLSAIAVASELWKTRSMRQKTEELLDMHYPEWRNGNCANLDKSCLDKLSPDISKHVFRRLNKLNRSLLCEAVRNQIEKKVLEMLEEIFNWIMYLVYDLKLDYEVTEIIYWTSYGLIDVDKIFRLFWMNRFADRLVPWRGFDHNLSLLQYLACIFGQEEFILLHQMYFIDAIKSDFPLKLESDFDIVFTIMKIVISYYNYLQNKECSQEYKNYLNNELSIEDYCNLQNQISTPDFYDQIRSTEIVKFCIIQKSTIAEMLDVCESLSFHYAFASFWNRLGFVQKYRYLDSRSLKFSALVNAKTKFGSNYLFQIAIFLLNKMHDAQRYHFMLNNFSTLIFLLSRKQRFQNFCISSIEHFFPKLLLKDLKILSFNCEFICKTTVPGNVEVEIIKRVLNLTLEPDRTDTFWVATNFRLIKTLFEGFNLPILNSLINDEDLAKHRYDLISCGKKKYKELMENNDFQLLNEFINEVLISEEEKNKFKNDFNFLKEWIADCKFDVVDYVLVWMHGPEYYKFKVALKTFSCSVIPIEYECIDKLLKWYLDAREPLINSCKNRLVMLKEFCRELIYNIWFRTNLKTSYDAFSSTELSTKALLLVFGSEEEVITFKKTELIMDESFLKIFCENEVKMGRLYAEEANFDIVDSFLLYFCSLPSSEIHYIKRLVSDNIHRYIVEYSAARLNIVVPLLDWVYGKRQENCYILENCFENPAEVILYYSTRK